MKTNKSLADLLLRACGVALCMGLPVLAACRRSSEVPQPLTVAHQGVLPIGATTFNITADAGAIVALTMDGEIVGVAEATVRPWTWQ